MEMHSQVRRGIQEGAAQAVEDVLSRARRRRLGTNKAWPYVHEVFLEGQELRVVIMATKQVSEERCWCGDMER